MAKSLRWKVTMPLDDLEGSDLSDQVIERLWIPSQSLEKDCRVFCGQLRDWLMVGKEGIPHWRRLAKTWEGFCRDYIQKPPEFVDALMIGYESLDKNSAIPARVALETAKSRSRPELAKHGENGKDQSRSDTGKFTGVSNINSGNRESKGGTKVAYLTDRLRTRHPDIFEKLERGEYRSIHAAAVDAGICRREYRLPQDPEAAAAYLLKRVDKQWIAQFVDALNDHEA
jgi:hypothetical protein